MNKKKGLFDHIALKILALLISFVLWIVVTNISNPTITKTINDIPVKMLNAETIAGDNKVYDITGGKTVSILVKGPRSVVEPMEESSFEATADLSKLSVVNSTTIDVYTSSSVKASDAKKIDIIELNQYVTLSIEEKVERTITVDVKTIGKAPKGRAFGEPIVTPDAITVSGPASVLDEVDVARAVVDIDGISVDTVKNVEIGLTDKVGTAIETDNLELSVSEVGVEIPVYKTKMIPVNVEIQGEPADGYKIKKPIQYNPSEILVCGKQEDLDKIKSIDITDSIQKTDTKNIEKSININDYLPDNIFAVDESQNMMTVEAKIGLNVKIEKMVEKSISIEKDDINIKNKKSNYDYVITGQDTIQIKLSGFEEHIADITLEQLEPCIDVANLEPGEYELEIELKDSETFVKSGTYTVNVEVKEKE